MRNDDERPFGLSPAQVAGSALAAMSGALVASWAGTTGTIIGAAVGSLVATIGAATYTWSLRRTSAAVLRTAAQVRQTALQTNALPRTVADGPLRPAGSGGPSRERTTEPPVPRAWDLPWGKVVLASAAVGLAAMAGITTLEAISGQPFSAWTGGQPSAGTTLGHAVGADSGARTAPGRPAPTVPDPSSSPTGSQTGTSTGDPAGTPTPDPVPTPDPAPSSPADPGTGTPVPVAPGSLP